MRYFFLTFQIEVRHFVSDTYTYQNYRAFVMRLGNRWAVQALPEQHANAFRGDASQLSSVRWGSTYGFHVAGMSTEYEVLEHFKNNMADRIINIQMTELTAHQRKYLLSADGYVYHDKLLDRLYYGATRSVVDRKLRALRDSRRERLLPNRSYGYGGVNSVTLRGGHQAYNHAQIKEAYKGYTDLAELVRDAIRDEDTETLEDFFVDGDFRYLNERETFERISDSLSSRGLDMDIMYCECGHFEHARKVHTVQGDDWCESCFNEDAVYVEDRDEYWTRDDAYWSENHDAYYSYDRDERDAEEEQENPDRLMEYSTNVLNHIDKDTSIKSSPHGEFLMGIEFEMTTTGYVNNAVSDVRGQLGDSYCVCKYDGSLSDGGLEIVTAPRGLPEHIRRFKKWDVKSEYRAWDRKCCGMHIHIDSHAFTQMTLGKFIMFINDSNNMQFVRKIAGRHPERDEQARSYAAAEDQNVLVNPSKAVKGKSYERYRMVNLQNLSARESQRLGFGNRFDDGRYDTVELRIFRASLKKERLLAQIEFTHAAVMFCRVASWRELNQANFLKWLKGSAQGLYPHLSDWYGVRRRVPVCNEGKQAICEDQPEAVAEGD